MITFLDLKGKSRNDCIELAKSYVVIIMAKGCLLIVYSVITLMGW
jgi:hypothetical protein